MADDKTKATAPKGKNESAEAPAAQGTGFLAKFLAEQGIKVSASDAIGTDIGRWAIKQVGPNSPVVGWLYEKREFQGGVGEKGWEGFLLRLALPTKAVFGKGDGSDGVAKVREVQAGTDIIIQPNDCVEKQFDLLLAASKGAPVPVAVSWLGTYTKTKQGFNLADIEMIHISDPKYSKTREDLGLPPPETSHALDFGGGDNRALEEMAHGANRTPSLQS